MSAPTFEHHFRVALHDTDAAGVLFFAHLFRHAHDAYEAWMTQLGFPLDAMLRAGDLRLPLVHAEADYRRPLHHGAAVSVQITPAAVGAGSFTLHYRFRTGDGNLAATARTVHAAIDADGRRSLPAQLRQALENYPLNNG
ncbi:thioesterase family protein [uncultured Thiohalocapsa sp.]|uniref:acyl-CoA thioesterase n=1 Tax=uncultured Thiohalocapsa sp. TaxID=768990 RepID=UPI0025E73ED1|nr:thioesterase family protein [uncultured Thiohalocapsa sp.]